MKVLMFGWEFPPKIYGGLAVASYGITKGLSLQGDIETTFCMPKPCGEEEKFLKIISMSHVPIVWRDADYDYLKSRLPNGMTPKTTIRCVIISIPTSPICMSTTLAAWSLRAVIREICTKKSITSP